MAYSLGKFARRGGGARSVTATLCAVGLLVAGCSSSSRAPSAAGATTVAAAGSVPSKTLTGTPIEVGTIMAASGSLGDPLFMTMANVWVKWTNAHGGINGHPVHLTALDEAGNAATALTEAKQLVQQNHVIAIIGSNSSTALSWLTYTNQAKVPVIGGTSAFLPGAGAYAFPAAFSVSESSQALIQLAKKLGTKKYAALYCAEAAQCSQAQSQFAKLAAAAGLPLYAAPISSTAPDYTAPCLSVKSSGADMLSLGSSDAVFTNVAKTCVQNGYTGAFMAPGNANPNWNKNPDLSKLRIYSLDYAWPFDSQSTPAQADYFKAINTYQPNMLSSPLYTVYLQIIWAGMQMFAAAAKAANIGPSSTPTDVVNGLYSLHDETLGGLIGPVTYNRSDANHLSDCYFVNQLDNGQWTDPFGTQPQCIAPQS